MFCAYRGSSVQVGGNFCGKCGNQVDDNVATSLYNAHDIGDVSRIEFGAIRKRLKLSNWDFLSSETLEESPVELFPELPPGYNPSSTVDVIVTDNYFVVLKAPPLSATYKLAEKLSINTMGLGLAGGALAHGAALVGEGYEKLLGSSNILDAHSLAICFESGSVMFAKRSDCHMS